MRAYIGMGLLLVVTGCASVTGSKVQPVSVQTFQENKEIAGANCTLTNDEGKWSVTTPGSVIVHKSTDNLLVFCNKDKTGNGSETVVSKANGGAWGNILLGGPIGYVADRETGAGFNYPPVITVILNKMAEVVGAVNDSTKPPSSDQPVVATTSASIVTDTTQQ